MANELGMDSRSFLQRYHTAINAVHKEICGEADASPTALDRFLDNLGRDPDGPGMSVAFGIAFGRLTKPEVATEYRRFLGNGRNCPEGSTGFAKWATPKTITQHVDTATLRDKEAREKFMVSVAAMNDPAAYARAWNDYTAAVSWIVEQMRPALEALARREAAGERPPLEEVQQVIGPLEDVFSASAVFSRDRASTIRGSWEEAFVRASHAQFGNIFNSVLPYVGMIAGSDRKGNEITRIVENVGRLFEPFDHIYYSFSSVFKTAMREFLEVETPDQSIEVKPANPIALQQLIDTIIAEGGRTRKDGVANRIRIAWDEATRTISFTDVGTGALALERFAASSGTETKAIVVFAGLLGPGADIRFDSDQETGRLTSIRVVVPQKGAAPTTGVPPPKADVMPEAKAQRVPFSSVATIDEETKRMVEGTFDRLAPEDWKEAGTSEQEEAIANVTLYAQTFGESLPGVDDIVYRAALSCALSGTEMPLVRVR